MTIMMIAVSIIGLTRNGIVWHNENENDTKNERQSQTKDHVLIFQNNYMILLR